jgi:hypothetical protein
MIGTYWVWLGNGELHQCREANIRRLAAIRDGHKPRIAFLAAD